MKPEVFNVLKRNGIVSVLVITSISVFRLISQRFFWPAAITVLFASVVGFVWASRSLREKIGRIGVGVLVTLSVLIVGYFSLLVSVLIPRKVVEYRYRVAGYEMRTGCNLAAANHADISLFTLSNRIDGLREHSPADTEKLRQLQEQCAATKRHLEFLEADIRLRGHRDTFPGPINSSK